jgi:hypothetical protein
MHRISCWKLDIGLCRAHHDAIDDEAPLAGMKFFLPYMPRTPEGHEPSQWEHGQTWITVYIT